MRSMALPTKHELREPERVDGAALVESRATRRKSDLDDAGRKSDCRKLRERPDSVCECEQKVVSLQWLCRFEHRSLSQDASSSLVSYFPASTSLADA